MAGDTAGRTAGRGYSADGVRQRFTGYERDSETGLDFARARYFAAAQGRFTSTDPLLASARAGHPQTWNRYAYALNNPLRYTDPSGMSENDENEGEQPQQATPARQQQQPQPVDLRRDPTINKGLDNIRAKAVPLPKDVMAG